MTEDLTIDTAKYMHIYRVLKMELGTQTDIAKALGVSVRTLRNHISKMREQGWDIAGDIIDEPHLAMTVEMKECAGGYRFPSNKERINYKDNGKRKKDIEWRDIDENIT